MAQKIKSYVDYTVDWVIVACISVLILAAGPWMLYIKFAPVKSMDPLVMDLSAIRFTGGLFIDWTPNRPTVFETAPFHAQVIMFFLVAVLTLGFADSLVNFLPAILTAHRQNPSWREFVDGGGPGLISSLTACSITAGEKKFDILRNLVGALCSFPVNTVGRANKDAVMVHLIIDEGHRPWVRELYEKFGKVLDCTGGEKEALFEDAPQIKSALKQGGDKPAAAIKDKEQSQQLAVPLPVVKDKKDQTSEDKGREKGKISSTQGFDTLYFLRLWARHLADPYRVQWEEQSNNNKSNEGKGKKGGGKEAPSLAESNPFDPTILPPLSLLTKQQQAALADLKEFFQSCDKTKATDPAKDPPENHLHLLQDDVSIRRITVDSHSVLCVYGARSNPKAFDQVLERWRQQGVAHDDWGKPTLLESIKDNLTFTTRTLDVGNWANLRFSRETLLELFAEMDALMPESPSNGGESEHTVSPTNTLGQDEDAQSDYPSEDHQDDAMSPEGTHAQRSPQPPNAGPGGRSSQRNPHRDRQIFSLARDLDEEMRAMHRQDDISDMDHDVSPQQSNSAPAPAHAGDMTPNMLHATPQHAARPTAGATMLPRERLREMVTPHTRKNEAEIQQALAQGNEAHTLSEWEARRQLYGKVRAVKPFNGDKKRLMVALDVKWCPALLALAKEMQALAGTSTLFRLHRDRYLWVPLMFVEPLQASRGKAGGLNFGLDVLKYRQLLPRSANGDRSAAVPGGPFASPASAASPAATHSMCARGVDLFAIIDCRHMALPMYFENTLPYFFKRLKKATAKEPKPIVAVDLDVASVQPPHRFQLPPGHENDAFNMERHFDYNVMCLVRDGVSAVTSHGSGGIWRLPTRYHQLTKIEDTATSEIRILDGYQFRFCPDMCTIATPKEPSDFLGAQQRWAEGSVQLFWGSLFTTKIGAPKRSTLCYFDKAYVHPKAHRLWLVAMWLLAYVGVMFVAVTRNSFWEGFLVYEAYVCCWIGLLLFLLSRPFVHKVAVSDTDEEIGTPSIRPRNPPPSHGRRNSGPHHGRRGSFSHHRGSSVGSSGGSSIGASTQHAGLREGAESPLSSGASTFLGQSASAYGDDADSQGTYGNRRDNSNLRLRSPRGRGQQQRASVQLQLVAGQEMQEMIGQDNLGIVRYGGHQQNQHITNVQFANHVPHAASPAFTDRELLYPPGEAAYKKSGRAMLCRAFQHIILFQNISYWWNSWSGFFWAIILPAYLVFSGFPIFRFDIFTWCLLSALAKLPSFVIYARLQSRAGGLAEKYVWKSVKTFFNTIPLFALMAMMQGTFSAWSIIWKGADRSYWTSFGAKWSKLLVRLWLMGLLALHGACAGYIIYLAATGNFTGSLVAGVMQVAFILLAINESAFEIFGKKVPKFSLFKVMLLLELGLLALTPVWYSTGSVDAMTGGKAFFKNPKQELLARFDIAGDVEQYSGILNKTVLFFEAQQSGDFPTAPRLTWRHKSGMTDGYDLRKFLQREDVDAVGGYYDGTMNTKNSLNTAFAMSLLGWAANEFPAGVAASGQGDHLTQAMKVGLDYLLKCAVDSLAPEDSTQPVETSIERFIVQVGSSGPAGNETAFWGRPEDWVDAPMWAKQVYRPTFYVDKALTGAEPPAEAAAAMAIAAVMLKQRSDAKFFTFAKLLEKRAVDLVNFADLYQGNYSLVPPLNPLKNNKEFPSFVSRTGHHDELGWAFVWLFKLTKNQRYLARAEALYRTAQNAIQLQYPEGLSKFDYDSKLPGLGLLLWQLTDREFYRTEFEQYFLNAYMDPAKDLTAAKSNPDTGGYAEALPLELPLADGVKRFKRLSSGMVYVQKNGTAYYAASASFLATLYSKTVLSKYKGDLAMRVRALDVARFARQQLDSVMGYGKQGGKSFVVDVGSGFPLQPAHKGASCFPIPAPCDPDQALGSAYPNPVMLTGALVSGPDEYEAYMDNRQLPEYSAVTLYWNAGLAAAQAGLLEMTVSMQAAQDWKGLAHWYGAEQWVIDLMPEAGA